MSRRRAVFLDRDGVINENVLNPETGVLEAPLTPMDFRLYPWVIEVLRRLTRSAFLIFLVSNQPNYAKGKNTLMTLQEIHRKLSQALSKARLEFAGVYYCLHHPDATVPGYSGPCTCRKPLPGSLFRAAEQFTLDMQGSWMVGDRLTDIVCGQAAGVKTILVGQEGDTADAISGHPDYAVADLEAAASVILREGPRPTTC